MSDKLEARVNALEEQNKALQKRLTTLEDIEAVKKLQRAYGYYVEHLMCDEVADLWTDDGETIWLGFGRCKGKETIRKVWEATKKAFAEQNPTNYIHLAPQISPYITVAPDGKTAYGRWYTQMHGGAFLYESTYVKEDEVWKIKVLQVGGFPQRMPGTENMSEPEVEISEQEHFAVYPFTEHISRLTMQEWPPYIRPFSFKHPVTGKDVNKKVEAWNKAHPVEMPPGGEKWTAKE